MGSIEFKPEKAILTPIIEEPAVQTPAKRQSFKLETYVMSDKYEAMRDIRKKDPTAEFKITGDWSLKVRTNLTQNDLMTIMMECESFTRVKPAWFF